MINIEKITKNKDKMCNHCNKMDTSADYYCLTFKNGGISTQVMLCENCLKELQKELVKIKIPDNHLVILNNIEIEYLWNYIEQEYNRKKERFKDDEREVALLEKFWELLGRIRPTAK